MILQGASEWDSSVALAQRRLRKALALSAAVHLVVLSTGNSHQHLAIAQPLTVTLRDRPAVSQAPYSLTEPNPRQLPVQTRKKHSAGHKRTPKESSRRLVLAASASPAAPRIQSTQPARVEPDPAVERTVPRAKAPAPANEVSSDPHAHLVAKGGPPAVDGVDRAALRDYSFAVSRAVEKRYPPLAIEQGWTGTARVRLTVGPEDLHREVNVIETSGHAVLDAQARTSIAMAVRVAALPAALIGRRFELEFPVEFSLDDLISER
jgi:periplasmic protein TonB